MLKLDGMPTVGTVVIAVIALVDYTLAALKTLRELKAKKSA